MKKVLIIISLILVGVLAFAGVTVRVNPQMLPPKAPFAVLVDSDIANISQVIVTFNGETFTQTSVPANFTFYAPDLSGQTSISPALTVKIVDKKGVATTKTITIKVSEYANPVIVMTPMMNVEKGSFKGRASFDVKVYGGIGVKKIMYFVDGSIVTNDTWKNPNPASPLGIHEEMFNVDTSRIPNGKHIFSVGVMNTTGKVFSSESLSYTLNNTLPLIEVKANKGQECLPPSTDVAFKITAISTLSGINYVEVGGKKATRISTNTFTLDLNTPNKTEKWLVPVVAVDNAGNSSSVPVSFFIDGSKPELYVESDADYVQKEKDESVFWKKATPLTITINASAASERCCDVVFTVDGEKQSLSHFTTKISTPGTYSLSATVVDPINGLTTSTMLNFVFKVDSEAPSLESLKFVSKARKNAEGYRVIAPTSTLTVTITATDGTGAGVKDIEVSPAKVLGKGDTRTFYISQLKEGKNDNYSIKIKLLDMLNNSTTIKKFLKIFVDGAAPTIEVKPQSDLRYSGTYWNKELPMMVDVYSNTESGIAPYVSVKVNSTTEFEGTATSQPIEVKFTKAGVNNITVVSTNIINGKKKEYSKDYSVNFDNTPPTIDSVTAPSTAGPNRKIIVKVKAKDGGIGLESVTINGVEAKLTKSGEYAATLVTPNWKESNSWTVKVTAKDRLGNESSRSANVYIDTSAPHITFSLFPNNFEVCGTYWTKDVPFFVQVSAKTDSGVKPVITSQCDGVLLSQDATVITKDGDYTITAEAVNPVNGLRAKKTATYTLKFDRMSPMISDVTVNATSGPGQEVKVKAKIVDEGIGELKYIFVNNIRMKEVKESDMYEATIKTPLYKESGLFNLKITAGDVFGNKAVYPTKVFVDAEPPTVNLYLKSGKKAVLVNDNSAYFFKNEPTLWYEAVTDGKIKPITKMYLDCEKEVIENGSKISGTHFIEITSTNVTNNMATTINRRFTVIVDNTKPTIKMEIPSVINATSGTKISISINDEYLRYAVLTVKSEDGKILYRDAYDENGKKTLNLADKLKDTDNKYVLVELVAYDMAGNYSQILRRVKVDTVPPSIESAKLNEGVLEIKMSENVKGDPQAKVTLISQSGEKLIGIGKIEGNMIYVYKFNDNKKVKSNEKYKVGIEDVTDNAGNVVENKFKEWWRL
ncbi:hypothetical protein [Mesoaciditoga lauensis]|uniref:hypothetical protein n=1 Tax=Mesoaciditoga lauensis TaxID=1495039 RepID=UPI0005608C17|nr:hypothetical protein [Mesoaciditoga lauensis]